MSEKEPENKKPKGLFLKDAREKKELSLEGVHEATKIPLDVLRSIEEGYTVRTISPFYLKGFMKMYAQYLGVNVHEVIEDYHEEKLPEPVKIKVETPVINATPNFENFFTQQRQRQMIIIGGGILLLFIITRVIGCVRQSAYRPSQKKKVVGVNQQNKISRAKEKKRLSRERQMAWKALAQQEQKSIALKAAARLKPAEPSVAAPVTKKVIVTVKAKRKAWLQVRVDGRVVFQSTLKEGISETWEANEMIEFSGKNIYYLDFEINGKMLGNLGRIDRNARRIVITKHGLTVKK